MKRIVWIAALTVLICGTPHYARGGEAVTGAFDHILKELTLTGNGTYRITGSQIEHYYGYYNGSTTTNGWYSQCGGHNGVGGQRVTYEWDTAGGNALTLTDETGYYAEVSGEIIRGSGNRLTITGSGLGGLIGSGGIGLSDDFDSNGSARNRNTLIVSGAGRIIDGTVDVNRGDIIISGGQITNAKIIADHNNGTGNLTGNIWQLTGGEFRDSLLSSTSNTDDGYSGFSISGSASFNSASEIVSAKTAAAGDTVTSMTLGSMTTALGFDGKIDLSTDINTLSFSSGANFNINATAALKGGTSNTVSINVGNTYGFQGVVDLSDTATNGADNTVYITSGIMSRNDKLSASVIGSAGAYAVSITGGYMTYFDAYTGDGSFVFNGGQIYNISDSMASNKADLGTHTIAYGGGYDYLAFSLLNIDTIEIGQDSTLTIGYNADPLGNNDYADFSLNGTAAVKNDGSGRTYDEDALTGQEAQITADTVIVHTGSKLVIHENAGKAGVGTTLATDDDSNIINHLVIAGTVTLDRTTIHSTGSTPASPAFIIEAGGILHGFSEFTTASDHSPVRPTLAGDLQVKTGGRIQPYDKSLFFLDPADLGGTHQMDGNIEKLMGVVLDVSGNTEWQTASTLSTRLFSRNDGTSVMDVDGITGQQLSFSDSVYSTTFDFSAVWDGTKELANSQKVQYDPVFGFAYELKAKQEFAVYKGDGSAGDTSYYFNVALSSGSTIQEFYRDPGDTSQGFMDDANHLFSRDILKSDMLGEWYFLQNDDRDGVVLRFRLLAAHPTQGGIAAGMKEPNAIEAARKIDEMRYPFSTAFGDLGFNRDPSEGLGWGADGYDGNIVDFYANNAHLFDQYNPAAIQDFDEYLRAVQREIVSGSTLNEAMRLLHAEAYVSSAAVNIATVGHFINNRERNAVSGLFSVESANFEAAAAEAASYASGSGYASVNDDLPYEFAADMFVTNPVRFWASGFGSEGKTKKRGTEYGYDTEVYGGSLGMVKELRDIYLGFTLGFSRGTNKWDELKASARTRSYMAEALVGVRKGLGFAELHANYAWNDNKMTRRVFVNNYSRTAVGDYDDHTFALGARIGYQKVICDDWLLIPTIGLQYYRNDNFSGFSEKSVSNYFGRMKFRNGAFRRHLVKLPVMARLNRSFAWCDMVVTPEVRVGATVTMGQRSGTMKYEYAGNPLSGRFMRSVGYDPGAVSGQAGATLEVSRQGRMYMAANYDYYFAKRAYSHNYSIQTGLNF